MSAPLSRFHALIHVSTSYAVIVEAKSIDGANELIMETWDTEGEQAFTIRNCDFAILSIEKIN